MPIVDTQYNVRSIFRNGHIQTIVPYIIRKAPKILVPKQTLDTPDGDEISYFHFKVGSPKLVVITHGLEGRGDEKYILHLTKLLNEANVDVITWNMRSCGGKMNKTKFLYTGFHYQDLELICETFAIDYMEINLVGISLGGSITGNYISRNPEKLNKKITKATLLSTPLDLESSRNSLENNVSKVLYQRVFINSMKYKVKQKVKHFNIDVDLGSVKRAKYISEIDDLVIAPLYGYKDGSDYRKQASCLPYLNNIKIPLLIINALDDPFLGTPSYPYELAKANDLIFLETPKHGGHIGFIKGFREKLYHHEKIILNWINK